MNNIAKLMLLLSFNLPFMALHGSDLNLFVCCCSSYNIKAYNSVLSHYCVSNLFNHFLLNYIFVYNNFFCVFVVALLYTRNNNSIIPINIYKHTHIHTHEQRMELNIYLYCNFGVIFQRNNIKKYKIQNTKFKSRL